MLSYNAHRLQVLRGLASYFAAEPAAVSVTHDVFGLVTREDVARDLPAYEATYGRDLDAAPASPQG